MRKEENTQALAYEMKHDGSVVVLGEDVGVNDGVFRATQDLQEKFGELCVLDTPLDEATSELNSEADAAIRDSLDLLIQGKTVIAIAHHLSTIARIDRLVVMDWDHIAETGTHAELIVRGGPYTRLWKCQTGGFLTSEPQSALV